jgi:outer membrane lipoprotein SlyB
MKTILAFVVFGLVLPTAILPADAKGCIKGAVVGGIAGHYAGHYALLGAAAGCIIGRREAKKHEKAGENPSRCVTLTII